MMADEQIGLSARGAVTQPYVFQPPGTFTGYSPAANGCKRLQRRSKVVETPPPVGSRCADIAEVKYAPMYLHVPRYIAWINASGCEGLM